MRSSGLRRGWRRALGAAGLAAGRAGWCGRRTGWCSRAGMIRVPPPPRPPAPAGLFMIDVRLVSPQRYQTYIDHGRREALAAGRHEHDRFTGALLGESVTITGTSLAGAATTSRTLRLDKEHGEPPGGP